MEETWFVAMCVCVSDPNQSDFGIPACGRACDRGDTASVLLAWLAVAGATWLFTACRLVPVPSCTPLSGPVICLCVALLFLGWPQPSHSVAPACRDASHTTASLAPPWLMYTVGCAAHQLAVVSRFGLRRVWIGLDFLHGPG
jgi:hypothetical protein